MDDKNGLIWIQTIWISSTTRHRHLTRLYDTYPVVNIFPERLPVPSPHTRDIWGLHAAFSFLLLPLLLRLGTLPRRFTVWFLYHNFDGFPFRLGGVLLLFGFQSNGVFSGFDYFGLQQ